MPVENSSEIYWLVIELQKFPGYLGVLQYGSRARGGYRDDSDYDLVVVTTRSTDISRMHTSKVDLNFLTIEEIRAIVHRLRERRQYPWDTMLSNITVLDDSTGELESLACELETVAQDQVVASDGIPGLRFLVWYYLKNLRRFWDVTSPLRGQMTLFSAVSVLVLTHELIAGRQWQGLDVALLNLREKSPWLYAQLDAAVSSANSLADPTDVLSAAAQEILKDYGGLWDGRYLELKSWVGSNSRPEATVPSDLLGRIRAMLDRLNS